MRCLAVLCVFVLVGCVYKGDLSIELWWEIPGTEEYGTCWEAGVDQMDYEIVDRRGHVVYESRFREGCEDEIYIPDFEVGKYDLYIDGYGKRVRWGLVCTEIRVIDREIVEYMCDISVVERGVR